MLATKEITPGADLRGSWKLSDNSSETVQIDRPIDLVRYAFWVKPEDIVATPTWGAEGLEEYDTALKHKDAVRSGEILYDSAYGFIPTTGSLIEYEQAD